MFHFCFTFNVTSQKAFGLKTNQSIWRVQHYLSKLKKETTIETLYLQGVTLTTAPFKLFQRVEKSLAWQICRT